MWVCVCMHPDGHTPTCLHQQLWSKVEEVGAALQALKVGEMISDE